MFKKKQQAMLLIGPTGSGKTPLGQWLEKEGWGNSRCVHFDFGETLRQAASRQAFCDRLRESDIHFLKKVLKEGALLENETFYIAENILASFIDQNRMFPDDLLILNGLPRHVDQARDVEKIVDIRWVATLVCPAEIVFERIRLDTGGDRKERADDSLEQVKRKLAIYAQRTMPLLRHYRKKNVKILSVDVTVHATADKIGNYLKTIGTGGRFKKNGADGSMKP